MNWISRWSVDRTLNTSLYNQSNTNEYWAFTYLAIKLGELFSIFMFWMLASIFGTVVSKKLVNRVIDRMGVCG